MKKDSKKIESIDITPQPRILRTLGEIPFQPWQCLAELIDNSIDALARAEAEGVPMDGQRIVALWSGDGVGEADRVIEISDTALGMEIEQIQKMAKAGYSGNNPIENLGLFGMGFNIATARLGEKTKILSTKEGETEWVGIEIDFSEMIKRGEFSAPVLTELKRDKREHGTRIIVSMLRPGMYRELRNAESQIRRRLESIYTPILGGNASLEIHIQGKKLASQQYCIWSKSRYVIHSGDRVPAVIEIDRDLGAELFDLDKNSYIPRDAAEVLREKFEAGETLPLNIVERQKRLTGWIGVQRFSDPSDFGLNFIRNGRKILVGDKTLFQYENPLTGTPILEYPIELASTWGGRIIGELNVDYLLPTYQKNDFDRTDNSWLQTIEVVRGIGPLLPKSRKALGFEGSNDSPLGKLVNAYRRMDPGTKCLSMGKEVSRAFTERFRKGDPDYLNDDKWWEAAQEADREAADKNPDSVTEVDEGNQPTDVLDAYDPALIMEGGPAPENHVDTQKRRSSSIDELIKNSVKVTSLSGPYGFGNVAAFEVTAWELSEGDIWSYGDKLPALFHPEGVKCDFFFNPRHPFFAQFNIGHREILALYLAERFKTRDLLKDIGKVFVDIVTAKHQDIRIDKSGLQERANDVFNILRERIIDLLKPIAAEVLSCVHESSGEVEETVNQMLSNSELIDSFQKQEVGGMVALSYVPSRTLIRLVERYPEYLFDGKLFKAKYSTIKLSDEKATERIRLEARDRVVSFLKDAVWVLTQSGGNTSGRLKDELARCSHSIKFLETEVNM